MSFVVRIDPGCRIQQDDVLYRLQIIWLIIIAPLQDLIGQADSVILLPQVTVVPGASLTTSTGSIMETRVDTGILDQMPTSLDQWLSDDGLTYIKSYGLGSIATLSLRGGAAQHTAILWNGLPLTNPMLGQMDLSLLPLGLTDRAQLVKGGVASHWGSGAVDGAIRMDNMIGFGKGLKYRLTGNLGSWKRSEGSSEIHWSQEKLSTTTRLFYRSAKNNFKYTPGPGLPEEQLENAQIENFGVLQSLGLKFDDKNILSAYVWWQDSDRGIPATLRQDQSMATQKDNAFRTMMEFRSYWDNNVSQLKLGHFRESLDYRDPLINLSSRSNFNTTLVQLTQQFNYPGPWQFGVDFRFRHTSAYIENYGRDVNEIQWTASGHVTYHNENLRSEIRARQGFFENRIIPIMPSLGLEFEVNDWLELRSRISRNYRVPTLNDRYWQPGGNQDLLPEEGWSEEISVIMNWNAIDMSSNVEVSLFNKNLENWIVWTPITGRPYWGASNLARVWSRGVESSVSFRKRWVDLVTEVKGNLNYIRSTNQERIDQPIIEEGQRLFYVPEWTGNLSAKIIYDEFEFEYQHNWTDEVLGINQRVSSFQVGCVRSGYCMKFEDLSFTVFGEVDNVWNADYFIVEGRPMPGRNFQIGVSIKN
ncbi:MAG: TonB-dependent receptor [Saprospiraceae bacterium]|nr:TonB-dependent receptor [Saprospiraceae bacterium]